MLELAKVLKYDNYMICCAMLLLHKVFKLHSVARLSARFSLLAIASLYVVGKVRYQPFKLYDAAKAYFHL